jgi:hypothetical protein
MARGFLVVLALLTAGPSAAADFLDGLKQAWFQCLKSSFMISRSQTPDKNAAAEYAFRACATEDRALSSYLLSAGIEPDIVDAYRAHIKVDDRWTLRPGLEVEAEVIEPMFFRAKTG